VRWKTRSDCQSCEGQGEIIDQGDSRGAPRAEVSVRPVTLSDLDDSNELLQSGFWGQFKAAQGWKALAFRVDVHLPRAASQPPFGLLVLTRRLLRFFTIAYVPFGPAFDPVEGRGAYLSAIARALRGALPRSTLFLRFDLPWCRTGEEPAIKGRPRVRKAGSDVQPPTTVIVDTTPELAAILASMKHKTRYNIRLAEKKGVIVEEAQPGDFELWYALYEETARRDRIAIHSRAYYRELLRASVEFPGARPIVKLLLARHEGSLLAGNIVAFWKKQGVYLYGASSGEKRNIMPTYALQWDAIRRSREAGCSTYDLYGVPSNPDPDHPMFGLYQFKTGFSEQVLERWGTWDASYRPFLYAFYRTAEAVRMFYYRSFKKRSRSKSRRIDS
jgi:lipid II:glycine glycyltransferase (peptidoglycan interpeptide bridge formation enzyme)